MQGNFALQLLLEKYMSDFVFYGNHLPVVEVEGVFYVSVRHICDGIGISGYQDQYKKLTSNQEVFTCKGILTTGSDSKQYEMFCIPITRLNLWLGGISPSKVKPEIRSELIKYQCESRRIINYLKNRKDGSGLRYVKPN
jgi:hypothetical protein